MGLLRLLVQMWLTQVAILLLLLLSILSLGLLPLSEVYLPPDESASLTPAPAFTGPLAENRRLSGTAKLFDGLLQGPESVIERDGE